MSTLIHRVSGTLALTALLAVVGASHAAAEPPHGEPGEAERSLRMPDVLLPLRDLSPTLPMASPVAFERFAQSDANERRDAVAASLNGFGSADAGLTSRLSPTWERLSGCISRTGVRLLSVASTKGGNFALVAGSHGRASLQWTSSSGRDGAGHGLFNQLLRLKAHAE